MSSGKGKGRGPEVPAPDEKPIPDPGQRGYDAMQVLQSLMEMQKDVSAISTKTNRLITDVGKLDEKTGKLDRKLAIAEGFGIAAFILIPICAAFVWWLIGGQLERMRDELLPRPAATQPLLPPAAKRP